MFWLLLRTLFALVCVLAATRPARANFELAHEFTLETRAACSAQLLAWPAAWRVESFWAQSPAARAAETRALLAEYRASGDQRAVRIFLEEQGHPIFLHRVGSSGELEAKAGLPTTRLKKAHDSPSAGRQNAGIFFYTTKTGSARVIKLLRLHHETLAALPGTDASTPSLVHELAAAFAGELYGAPKVHGFGIAQVDGEPSVYLELERLFPREEFLTSKDLMRLQRSGIWQRDLAAISAPFPNGDEVIRRIARLVLRPLFDDVGPLDPDFAISRRARIRWIDTGLWQLHGAPRTGLYDNYEDLLWQFLPSGAMPGEPEFDAAQARASRIFFTAILRQLKATPRMSPGEKDRFLAVISRERPSYLAVGVSKNHALYQGGLIPEPSGGGRSAQENIRRIYESLDVPR